MIPTELLIALILRIIVMFICSFLLFMKWYKSEKRYLTDFPFIFGLLFATIGFAKIFDTYLAVNFGHDSPLPIFFVIMKFRYLFMALTFIELLVTQLVIWFRWNKRAQVGLLSIYSGLWAWILIAAPNYDALVANTSYLMVPLTLFVIFTFLFIYHQKRLPTFHALYFAIGVIGTVISQVLRPVLLGIGDSEWGMNWLNEVIDLVSWVIIFFAFVIKPRYETKKVKKVKILKRETGHFPD